MPFDWLKQHHSQSKPPDYAEKALAAYALGIRSGGSLRGVRVQTAEKSCQAAKALPDGAVYLPEDAPRLPLPACPQGTSCPCLYRPVMAYESPAEPAEGEAE